MTTTMRRRIAKLEATAPDPLDGELDKLSEAEITERINAAHCATLANPDASAEEKADAQAALDSPLDRLRDELSELWRNFDATPTAAFWDRERALRAEIATLRTADDERSQRALIRAGCHCVWRSYLARGCECGARC